MKLKTRRIKRWTSMIMSALLLTSTFLPSGLMNRAEAAIADHVVISQVYGGGGNTGATYTNDFIELYNPTESDVVLDNWSVQYASSTGSGWTSTTLTGTIKAHGYFLVQEAAGSTVKDKPLPTPDNAGSLTMAGGAGKVALVNNTTALSGTNPTGANIIDFVGYGSGTNAFEGTGPTNPSLTNTTSAQRRPYANVSPGSGKGNAWDTDDNAKDFVAATPVPKNTASPTEAPMVSNTSLQPIGNNIQLTKQGTDWKVTGLTSAVPNGATVNIYDSVTKTTKLSTLVSSADGSFEVNFSAGELTSVFVSATETAKEESDVIEIQKATESALIDGSKLSYMVDGNGVGTLIGNNGAGVASSIINIYPNDTATISERLLNQEVKVSATGAFTATINNAPNTIYVTQQSSSAKGIKLESTTVSVTKTVTDQVTPVKEVRQSDATTGKPVNLNKYYTIEGVVTVDNGILGTQKQNFYLQDATGGINVFSTSYDPGFKVVKGDKIRVTGKVIYYNGLTEFDTTSIVKIDEGNAVPVAKDVTILDLTTFAVAEPLEGSLVTLTGKVSATASTPPNYNVTIVDENNKATTLRVMSNTGITPDTDLVVGKTYTITGILGQYTTNANATNGYQVYPRGKSDIASVLNITHTPITEDYKDTNIEFEATVDGAESVKVYYRATGGTTYTALPMIKGSEGRYTVTLEAKDVPSNGFEYYIEAIAGTRTVTSGSSTTPHKVTLKADLVGPSFNGETPQDQSKVETPQPEISVLMNDPSGIDVDTVQLWVDGTEIKAPAAIINKSQVKYAVTQDLSIGNHTVKVSAKDSKGNSSEKQWTFEVVKRFTGGKHYRGTTHNHTNISHDGAGTPEDALKAGKAHNYDFFAFSDHSHDIDASLAGSDNVDRKGMTERTGGEQWQLTKDLAKQYTKNGDYVVFPAFEMTSTTWGHSNIFGTENFIDRNINGKQYQDLNKYYSWVLTYDDIVGQFNHPDMSANAFNSFKPYDAKVDKLFTMLEVGNGSGHYGYANADKKFYSTLDLGWHVAPTYGEDNHEGSWGQTNARTVIVADDLSQDSLMHSMRNMRVYMEEDPNFTLDVLANGYYMGSTVDSKTLNFDISGSDLVTESRTDSDYSYLSSSYQSDDRIAKVELITNGGKVVDSIQPMTKDFTWKPTFTVPSGQQWFVVKVTQMDGERIYSSPIWSKEQSVDVKVSGIDIVGDVIVGGNPATLKATVANNGTQTVNNLKVDFYYDEVKQENLIGTNNISSILSKNSATATATWNTPLVGDHQIIAVVTSLDGLDIGDVKFNLPVKIKEPLGIKVLIDAYHGNENTSGDSGTYRDNLKAYTVQLQKEGYTVVENKQTLTDAVLSNVQVLMITATRTALSADERTAVANFVKNGGSLLLTSKSNNSSDPTINNPLLADIGTKIRINNDGVFDDSKTGNFWSDPKVSPYAVRIHPGLVSNYITDRVSFLDYYSGVSLAGENNGPLVEGGKVVILGKGNETTYEGNIKGGYTYDNVSDETGGSAIPLIASEEIGEKGRIIVSGMNIFNDKQMDESYEPKGNNEFSLNAINWLAHRETKVSNIGDVRKLEEDKEAVIEGTVTTAAGVFFDAFYVQDETGGIMAFKEAPEGSLEVGDKVRIYGHIKTFENNKEFELNSFATDVIKVGKTTPIAPKEVTTGAATSEENQGLLVKVKGKVVSKYDANSYIINDGSGDTLVFTDGYITNQSGPVPDLKVGDTLEAVGLSGKFTDGNRIRVRDTKELVGSDTTSPILHVNSLNDKDVTINGTTEAGAKVSAKVEDLEIGNATADSTGKFEMNITKLAADTKVKITAVDENGNVSEVVEVIVIDATPPSAPVVNDVKDYETNVSGKAEAGSTIIVSAGDQILGQGVANQDGQFNISISEKQKAGLVISVVSVDKAGNRSTQTDVTVIDATAPAAPVVTAIKDYSTIIGKAEAGSTVTVSVGSTILGKGIANQDGNFSILLSSKQKIGTILSIVSVDNAGNRSSVTHVTVLDTTPPDSPVVKGVVKDNDKKIMGTAEANSLVVVKIGNEIISADTADSKGKFTLEIPRQKIGTVLLIIAIDQQGNESSPEKVVVQK